MTSTNGPRPRSTVYDRWSRHPRALDGLYWLAFLGREGTFRRRSIEALDLAPGETVLELGCGTGNSFARLRERVGPTGSVVGLDASRGMVDAARQRASRNGWQNVSVVRGDAQQYPVPDGTFDAVYAAMSLSAVPEPERAVGATRRVLRPGGRVVVLDAQPFQSWPWRVLNPLITHFGSWGTEWVPDVDIPRTLAREFDTLDLSTFNDGSIFVARAGTER